MRKIAALVLFALALTSTSRADLGKQIGLNVAPCNDATAVLANAVYHARPFAVADRPYQGSAEPVPIDAAGWPTTDFGTYIASGDGAAIAGRYTFRFTGQAIVSCSTTPGTIAQAYDQTSNTTTGTLDVSPVNNQGVYFVARGTRRLPTDQTATGITNLQIMRPIAPGSMTSHGFGELWARTFLQVTAPFTTIRNLDLVDCNGFNPGNYNWSNRILPSSPIQSTHGIAVEYQIALCNVTGANLWFCVPDTATADYVSKLCNAIRYGTDGVNPYTSPQANPVWPPLIGKPIFEFSNEVTFTTIFAQYGRNSADANAKAAASPPDPTINYDGQTNQYVFWFRQYGYRSLLMRNQVEAAYGGVGFNSLWYCVLGNQLGNGPNLTEAIGAIQHNDSRPLNQLFSKAGGSWYGNLNLTDPTGTPDQAIRDGQQYYPWTQLERSFLSPLGVGGCSYEGNLLIPGPGGAGGDNLPTNSVTRGIEADPRMYGIFIRWILREYSEGKDWLIVFNHGTEPWGICLGNDTTKPKFQACVAISQYLKTGILPPEATVAPLALPTLDLTLPPIADYGFEVGTLNGTLGNAFAYSPAGSPWTFTGTAGTSASLSSFTKNNDACPQGSRVAFVQNQGTITQSIPGFAAGTYTVTVTAALRAAASFPTQTVQVQIDGKTVGTIAPTSTTYAVASTPAFSLTAGAHTLGLVGTNNPSTDYTVFVDTVTIQRGGAVNPMNPVTPVTPNPTPGQAINGIGRFIRRILRRAA